MNTKTLLSTAPASSSRISSGPTNAPFAQRYTTGAAIRARFPTPPLGRLVDPFLLDRLQVPLSRFRD